MGDESSDNLLAFRGAGMIRVAITKKAYEMIDAALPGAALRPAERNAAGKVFARLNRATVNRLENLRQRGEDPPRGNRESGGEPTSRAIAGIPFLPLAPVGRRRIALALSSNLLGVAVGIVLWGLFLAFTQGVLPAMIADSAPAELRGTACSLFNFATGVALLAAGAVAGALWDAYSSTATFLAGAGFAILSLIGLTTVRGRIGRKD